MLASPRLLLLPSLLACVAAAQQPTNHSEVAQAYVRLLQQTEQILAGCRDAATVEAALPKLQKLAEQARAVRTAQLQLPDPTTADYNAVQALAQDFVQASTQISSHIERLRSAGLVSEALRTLLVLPPDDQPTAPAPES